MMKKFFITMLAVAATATSFAQNPEALKQILATPNRSDAAKLVKENESSLAPYEKVKAYTYIVNNALDENKKESEKALTLSIDPAKKDEAASHKTKQYEAANDAILYAVLAVAPDQEPNEKGKVAPKFKKTYAAKVNAVRLDLFNGAKEAYNNKDYANAKKWFSLYADSHNDPLFSDVAAVKAEKAADLSMAYYYAGAAALYDNDGENCAKFAKACAALNDPEWKNDAIVLELKGYDKMKTDGKLDDENYVKKYQQVYKENPTSSDVFTLYMGALYTAKKDDEAAKVLADRLKADPNDLMANAYLGQNAQEAADKAIDENAAIAKYDEAIGAYEKVLAAKPDFDAVKYNLAVCNRGKGVMLKNQKKPYKDFIDKAKKLFQEVQAKDPEEKMFKTKYILSTLDEL